MKNRLLRIDFGTAYSRKTDGLKIRRKSVELLQITDRGLEETCQNKSFPTTQ